MINAKVTDNAPIGVTILGATGSIGLNTLDVIERYPQRFQIIALTAHSQTRRLAELCIKYRPKFAVMSNPENAQELEEILSQSEIETKILTGESSLQHVATLDEVDYVMAAIVGAIGLPPTLAAAQAGKRVLLANKEALVMSGKLFMEAVAQNKAQLLPIDSEHNAIFQCLPQSQRGDFKQNGINKIVLTASGGPFREMPLTELEAVTPEQACSHPNWKMGKKISVDSATMMNKGLEVIEACWLFATTVQHIQVVVHPQSIIHSMVEYIDGSVIAQLGNPDMRTPIAHALAWPERMASGVSSLDLFSVGRLEFERPDLGRFPCLKLAQESMQVGGTCPAILNAANEMAVAAFLKRHIRFTDIASVIDKTLSLVSSREASNLEIVFDDDKKARQIAQQEISKIVPQKRHIV